MEENKSFIPPPPKDLKNVPPPPPPKTNTQTVVSEVSKPTAPVQKTTTKEDLDEKEQDRKLEEEAKQQRKIKDSSKGKLALVFYWIGFVACLAGIGIIIFLLVK